MAVIPMFFELFDNRMPQPWLNENRCHQHSIRHCRPAQLDIVDHLFGVPRRVVAHNSTELSQSEKEFKVTVDVNTYKPEELVVKTVGNTVVIEGTHEERPDEHGYISRKFVRRIELPDGAKPEQVLSSLSADGKLSISVPRPVVERQPEALVEKIIPIQHTGEQHKTTAETTAKEPEAIAK